VRFLDRIEDHWKDTLVKDIKPSAIRQMAIDALPERRQRDAQPASDRALPGRHQHAADAELCPISGSSGSRSRRRSSRRSRSNGSTPSASTPNSPYIEALALFMFATGARISEALAVRWEHVDLKARTITIPKSKISEQRRSPSARLLVAVANLPKVEPRHLLVSHLAGDLRAAGRRQSSGPASSA
jgi:integrase